MYCAAADLVDRRDAFERRVDFVLPQHLAGVGIERANLLVARAGEDQAGRGDHRADLRVVRSRIVNAFRRELRHVAERNLPRDRAVVQVVRGEVVQAARSATVRRSRS